MEEPDWYFIGESGPTLIDAATQTLASPTPLEDASSPISQLPAVAAGPAVDYGVWICACMATGCIGFGVGTLVSRLWSKVPAKGGVNITTVDVAPPVAAGPTCESSGLNALLSRLSETAPVEEKRVAQENLQTVWSVPRIEEVVTVEAAPAQHQSIEHKAQSYGVEPPEHVAPAARAQEKKRPLILEGELAPALSQPIEHKAQSYGVQLPEHVAPATRQEPAQPQKDAQYWQCAVVAGLGATLVASSVLLARFGMTHAVAPKQLGTRAPLLSAPSPAPPAPRTCSQPTPYRSAGPPAIAQARSIADAQAGRKNAENQHRPTANVAGVDVSKLQYPTPTGGLLAKQLPGVPQIEGPGCALPLIGHSYTGDLAGRIASNEPSEGCIDPTVDMHMKILCTSHTLRKTAHRAQEVWILGGRVCPPLPTSSAVFRLLPKQ